MLTFLLSHTSARRHIQPHNLFANGMDSANRIPERLSPGKFDYFFASHQIFHVCVVLAALSHYVCILTAFEHWHAQAEPHCSL